MQDQGLPAAVRIFLLRIGTVASAPPLPQVIDHAFAHSSPASVDTAHAPPVHTVSLDAGLHAREAMALLCPQEVERAGRLRDAAARATYACAHAALRLLLGHELGLASPPVQDFARGEFGKPFLAGRDGVHFSLSYRNGIAAIALAGVPVGIDVEVPVEGIDMAGIGARFFTDGERALLEGAAAGESRARFFELWTRKEALLKAAGLGVDAMPAAGTLKSPVSLAGPDGVTASYWLHQLASTVDHALALAVRTPHP